MNNNTHMIWVCMTENQWYNVLTAEVCKALYPDCLHLQFREKGSDFRFIFAIFLQKETLLKIDLGQLFCTPGTGTFGMAAGKIKGLAGIKAH